MKAKNSIRVPFQVAENKAHFCELLEILKERKGTVAQVTIFMAVSHSPMPLETAEKQAGRIMDAADSLGHMPLRHRRYEMEPWRSRGLRVLLVDNYALFYLPDEAKNSVSIIRIMHGSRDINMRLSETGE